MIQARNGLEKYFKFYNTKRKHQTLKARPNEVYYKNCLRYKRQLKLIYTMTVVHLGFWIYCPSDGGSPLATLLGA